MATEVTLFAVLFFVHAPPCRLAGALTLLALSLTSLRGHAEDEAPPLASVEARPEKPLEAKVQRKLRVGVAGSEPFVIAKAGVPDGLSVEVWREVARRADTSFELERVANVDDALQKVATGKLDAAVGPLSITAKRAQAVVFTQPYYHSSLAIAAQSDSAGVVSVVAPFLSKAFLVGTGTLLAVLFLVGISFWLAERRKNEKMFPAHPLKGIGNGVWLALVTMTTVGYGDRVPITPAGRVIGGIWMVIAMLTVSSLTAGIATTLTVASLNRGAIQSARELSGKRVAAVRGTTGASFARKNGARVVRAESVEQALALVSTGSADAVVHDRPILQYALRHSSHPDLELAEAAYEPQGYGFAVVSSELGRDLDIALLKAVEAGRIDTIARRWLEGLSDEDP